MTATATMSLWSALLVQQGSANAEDPLLSGLERISQAATNLLSPLLQVESRDQAEVLLSTIKPRYFEIRVEILSLYQQNPNRLDKFLTLLQKLPQSLQKMFESKIDVLGRDTVDQLSGVLESFTGFNDWVLRNWRKGEGGLQSLMVIVTPDVLDAVFSGDICFTAVCTALLDIQVSYRVEALSILSSIADEMMTNVEDVFLAKTVARMARN